MRLNQSILAFLVLSLLLQGCAKGSVKTGVCLSDNKGQRITANVLEEKKAKNDIYVQLTNTQSKLLLPVATYTLPLFSDLPKNGCFKTPFILSHTEEGYWWFDSSGNRLYEVYWFDNGPDYAEDGLFRFKKNGLIGYADESTYEIVIPAQYKAAYPFQNGKAQVSYEADSEQYDDEHLGWKNTNYVTINKQGKVISLDNK